jgi:ribosomal protein S18 acetylase RimI-like enzyme
LTTLRPIIVVREGSGGLGMQLRLVAGPLDDAAAAAKICAGLIENERPCETTVFDGQRLAMKADEPAAAAKPAAVKPAARRRGIAKRVTNEEPAKKPESSTLSSLFGKR